MTATFAVLPLWAASIVSACYAVAILLLVFAVVHVLQITRSR